MTAAGIVIAFLSGLVLGRLIVEALTLRRVRAYVDARTKGTRDYVASVDIDHARHQARNEERLARLESEPGRAIAARIRDARYDQLPNGTDTFRAGMLHAADLADEVTGNDPIAQQEDQ